MVTITKKISGKHAYYYLEHTLRKKGKIEKKEKYIGKELPKDTEKAKREFLGEIYKEKWHPILAKIKDNYSKERRKMPEVALEKDIEAFMVKFTYDTQRIEGSTLTLRETADLLEHGITPANKPIGDAKEAEAHKNVFYDMLKYKKNLSLDIVLHWHRQLFQATKPGIAGKIRQHQVAIARSRFMPPYHAEVYPMLMDFFRWCNKSKDRLHPVEMAALVHLKFVTIHPFADGNGRISRLMMNFALNMHKYPMFNIRYKNRSSYYNALERSQVKKIDMIFVNWFLRRYTKDYKNYFGK